MSTMGTSQLSNYGTNSLKNLHRISDKDVEKIQAKKFDIINNIEEKDLIIRKDSKINNKHDPM